MSQLQDLNAATGGGSDLTDSLGDDCEMRVLRGRGVKLTPQCRGNGHYQCADCALLDNRPYTPKGQRLIHLGGQSFTTA